MTDHPIAGIELGGTKCVATLATADGDIRDQATVPTTGPDETLGAIEDVLARWAADGGFAALGVASFGPVDVDPASARYGWITSTPKPGWRDTDVGRRLARRYPVPFAFDTDVNAAAFAEARWGAAQGLADFAYVTVGTGIGVGLIVNGQPTRGFGHSELGHLRVRRVPGDHFAGVCPYHGDCLEGLASGPAIKARWQTDHVGTIDADDLRWDYVIDALAQMAHALVLAACPRVILIGGGVGSGQPALRARVEARLIESIASYVDIPIPEGGYVRAPGLGDRAGPLGSVALGLAALGC